MVYKGKSHLEMDDFGVPLWRNGNHHMHVPKCSTALFPIVSIVRSTASGVNFTLLNPILSIFNRNIGILLGSWHICTIREAIPCWFISTSTTPRPFSLAKDGTYLLIDIYYIILPYLYWRNNWEHICWFKLVIGFFSPATDVVKIGWKIHPRATISHDTGG